MCFNLVKLTIDKVGKSENAVKTIRRNFNELGMSGCLHNIQLKQQDIFPFGLKFTCTAVR